MMSITLLIFGWTYLAFAFGYLCRAAMLTAPEYSMAFSRAAIKTAVLGVMGLILVGLA